MTIKICYIVGSISERSINRKLVQGIVRLAMEQDAGDVELLEFIEIPIDRLPMYSYDTDEQYPAEAREFKGAIEACDGLLIATPEYNRSVPGVLKNAIDWASRPYGENSFRGKPVGIIGASVGTIGTAAAQQHLRNILAYLDAPTLGQPEVFIQYTPDRFADDGRIIDPDTRQFLTDWLRTYQDWVERFSRSKTR